MVFINSFCAQLSILVKNMYRLKYGIAFLAKNIKALIFRHVGTVAIAIFIGFGMYGIFEFFVGKPPRRIVEFYKANSSESFPFKDHGKRIVSQYMQVGEILPNCGLNHVCPHDHFPVHIYSGKSNQDMPKICVSGKYIIQKEINNGGRGMNMVVVDSHRMRPINARRFDTYAMDSSEMELFLLREVKEGDILIAVTFDEASRNLGSMAKNLLAELGSSQIQNLQFRGQWYMVSQRGMKGFSPYEALKASRGGMWSPIDERFCLPRIIHGHTIMPDPMVHKNNDREEFCQRHTYIEEFCADDQREKALKPATLTNRQFVGSAIFSTPLMVLGGQSLTSLTLTMETILSQPGIQPRYVVVVYDPELIKDVPGLCRLFGFSHKATSVKEYHKLVEVVFDTALALFPGSLFVSIIEEGLLLAPDYLAYTATVLPLLHDPTVIAISAWNINGYTSTSSRSDLAYRVEGFPGQAFTIKQSTYRKELKPNIKSCCSKPGWYGWLELGRWEREIIIPDVSRVLRRPVGADLEPVTPLIKALFHRLRTTNLELSTLVKNAELLMAERYEQYVVDLLNSSNSRQLMFEKEKIINCANKQDINLLKITSHPHKHDKNSVSVVSYKEEDITGFAGMKILCQCFGLFYEESSPPQGLHRGIIMFSRKGDRMILLSNRSPHFILAPYNATKLSLP